MSDAVSVDRWRVEDYFAKVDYLVSHFNRMWNRFNFFLTFQGLALSALAFSADGRKAELTPVVAAIGLGVSVIWWMFGRQDKYLVDLYRAQIEESHDTLHDIFGDRLPRVIGDTSSGVGRDLMMARPAGSGEVNALWDWITRGRMSALSITRLPAALPAFLIIIWSAMLVVACALSTSE